MLQFFMLFKSLLSRLNRRDLPLFPKIPHGFKYVFIFLFIFASAFFSVRVLAEDSALKETVDGMNAGGGLESWLGKDSVRINAVGILNAAIDVNTINPELVQGKLPTNGQFFTKAPGGVVGATNGAIASLYHQPASGLEYLAEVKNNLLGKPAYAQDQGYGFQGLQPILPIWRIFRNAVYIIASFIFVLIGIMVMLRVKVSPQAVISIQNAIPNLITALILVTFSYAIAGLLIDLSNIILSLVLTLLFVSQEKSLGGNLFGAQLFSSVPVLKDLLNPYNFSSLSQAGLPQTTLLLVIPSIVTVALGNVVSFMIGFMIAFPLTGVIGGAAVGSIFGSVGSILLEIVLLVLIIIWLFKFLFGIFKCYATLLFKIILGPLEIGMGAFPNSKLNFSSWLTDVVANLAVFPVSFLFLVISNLIIANVAWGGFTGTISEIFKGNFTGGGMWVPPLLGGNLAKFGLSHSPAGVVGGGIAGMAIGVSTLLLLSKLPEMIPQFIFMIKPSPWGQAIGQGMNDVKVMPGQILSRGQAVGETAYTAYSFGRDVKNHNIKGAVQSVFGGKYKAQSTEAPQKPAPPDSQEDEGMEG